MQLSTFILATLAGIAAAIPTSEVLEERQGISATMLYAIFTTSETETTFKGSTGTDNSVFLSEGFTLVDGDGTVVYKNAYPGGYSACNIGLEYFSLSGDCLAGTYFFSCYTDAASGNIDSCATWADVIQDSTLEDCEKAASSTWTNVLSVGQKSSCTNGWVNLIEAGTTCTENADLTLTHYNHAKNYVNVPPCATN